MESEPLLRRQAIVWSHPTFVCLVNFTPPTLVRGDRAEPTWPKTSPSSICLPRICSPGGGAGSGLDQPPPPAPCPGVSVALYPLSHLSDALDELWCPVRGPGGWDSFFHHQATLFDPPKIIRIPDFWRVEFSGGGALRLYPGKVLDPGKPLCLINHAGLEGHRGGHLKIHPQEILRNKNCHKKLFVSSYNAVSGVSGLFP